MKTRIATNKVGTNSQPFVKNPLFRMFIYMKNDQKNIGVTQKAVVFREDGKFLIIRRGQSAPSNPLYWDLPGGLLEYGEDPTSGITREIKEEAGLEVQNLKPFDVFGHENSGGYWVTIAYTCEAKPPGEVALSFEHSEYRWVSKSEFENLPAPEKIIRFVKNFSFR